MLLVGCSVEPYPSDSLLEERFRTHQGDFERLTTIFNQDADLDKVTREAAWVAFELKANIPEQRLNEYRSLFDKLKVESIARGEKSGNHYILAWRKSDLLIGGSSKLYIYAEKAPSPIVDSLDELKNSGHDAYAFKRIADKWYLHLDIW